jgi:membrane-associated phospholipid phosphatase
MRKTFDALLRRRHRCCGATRSLVCLTWPIALVTLNLVLIGIFLLDAPVVSYAQHTRSLLKPLGSMVTDFGESGWIITISIVTALQAAIAYRLSPTLKGRLQAAFIGQMAVYIFLCVALSGITANLLKRLIGRARPRLFDELGSLSFDMLHGSAKFESFPSGHATTVGALMMAMVLIAPGYRLLFISMGLWLGFSRVIVGAHYPSDVMAGLGLGAWFSLAIAIAFSSHGLLFRRRADNWPVLRHPLPAAMPASPSNAPKSPASSPIPGFSWG